MAEGFFPGGRQAALSWSFDDARDSQLDAGIPLFNELGVPATFYVSPEPMAKRRREWKAALRAGHEVGNHTFTHPCTVNYSWSRNRALEEFSLERMAADIARAEAVIEQELGVGTTTFAYPCGHTYVGRGRDTGAAMCRWSRSDLWSGEGIGEQRTTIRNAAIWRSALAFHVDDMRFEEMKKLVDGAMDLGAWVIFAGHDFGAGGTHVTRLDAVRQTAAYCRERAKDLWVATVAEAGAAIKRGAKRRADRSGREPRGQDRFPACG